MLELLFVTHLLTATPAAQERPPKPSPSALDPIDQLGQETCENLSAGGEVEFVDTTDYADWVDERAPDPKDDYETDNQYRFRQQMLWRAMLEESPVVILSHPIRVTRDSSRYDPETNTLTLSPPPRCTSQQSDACLPLSNSIGQVARYLTVQGVDLHPPLLNIPPQTARRLREQDSDDEITLFMVATPIRPYRTRASDRVGPADRFHVGVYCAVYHWNDDE